jgi:hypothetical protein
MRLLCLLVLGVVALVAAAAYTVSKLDPRNAVSDPMVVKLLYEEEPVPLAQPSALPRVIRAEEVSSPSESLVPELTVVHSYYMLAEYTPPVEKDYSWFKGEEHYALFAAAVNSLPRGGGYRPPTHGPYSFTDFPEPTTMLQLSAITLLLRRRRRV